MRHSFGFASLHQKCLIQSSFGSAAISHLSSDIGEKMTTLKGTLGNDTLTAGEDTSTIYSFSGDDVINLTDTSDSVRVRPDVGNDTINANGKNSLSIDYTDIFKSSDDGSVTASLTANSLTIDKGEKGTDTLQNFSTSNYDTSLSLYLGAGNDSTTVNYDTDSIDMFFQVIAGSGNDTITSESGQVRVSYLWDDAISEGITYNSTGGSKHSGTVVVNGSGSNSETDTLTNVSEIEGSKFADTYNGGAGDERFITGGGDDTVLGGDGYDRLRFDRSNMEAVNVDMETGKATGTYRGETFEVSFTGIERVEGSREGDTLRGSSGADRIDADKGDDFVILGDGDDIARGEDGNDTIYAGAGDTGNDYLEGNAGNDILGGGAGNDVIYGGDDNDVIFGGAGNDKTKGGSGLDTIWAGTEDDSVEGEDGNDILGGGEGDDTVSGGNGNDVIYSAAGNDTLTGGDGDDTVFGGAGNDRITGDAGNDALYGGAGNDVFVFASGHGEDSIGGFKTKGDNTIDLTALGLSGFLDLTVAQSDSDVSISTGQGTITLWFTTVDEISAGDFLF
ncbi:MAG: hypothetical protein MJH10_19660 [Epibacterium sp.]|nr:hypothetical protein [Epibacterium sp.]NQX75700.1 hypothetical protein [Epibacterium sp.]